MKTTRKNTIAKNKQIRTIQKQLFTVDKYQLPAPAEGFDKPEAVGIYKTSGQFLGIAKDSYGVLQPQFLLDSIVSGLDETNYDYINNKIEYKAMKEDKVISFKVPMYKIEHKNKAGLNDIIETYMLSLTSFDGSVSSTSSVMTERLVCLNGMVRAGKDMSFRFRHTDHMNNKMLGITEAMAASADIINDFETLIKKLDSIEFSKNDMNRIIKRITGYNVKEYKDLHKTQRNILDGINNGLKFEKENAGIDNTAWALMNAFTYHTNHDLDGNHLDSRNIIIDAGYKFNAKVQAEFARIALTY